MVTTKVNNSEIAADAPSDDANSAPDPASYSEKWSLHPGEALRRKRGLTAKEQQALAKQPTVLPQEVFESPALRRKAFYADESCLIFCGEVREVLGVAARRGYPC